MLKIVIIEPDVQKQGQIRQTLEQELVSWLEPNFFMYPRLYPKWILRPLWKTT